MHAQFLYGKDTHLYFTLLSSANVSVSFFLGTGINEPNSHSTKDGEKLYTWVEKLLII